MRGIKGREQAVIMFPLNDRGRRNPKKVHYPLAPLNHLHVLVDPSSVDPDSPEELAKFLGFSSFESTKVYHGPKLTQLVTHMML